MYVKLSQKEFEIYCAGVKIVIGLNLSTKEYSRLDKTLRKRFKGKVVMMNE
jgi:F0F1-type ATP synthase delta subunit